MKHFAIFAFACLTVAASLGFAGDLLPPPPTQQPVVSKPGVVCNVSQYYVNCGHDMYGRPSCMVGPEIAPDLVTVNFYQGDNGILRISSVFQGETRPLYMSKKAMTCDWPTYSCTSADGTEKINVIMVLSPEWGTDDFTVRRGPSPTAPVVFGVKATAHVDCVQNK